MGSIAAAWAVTRTSAAFTSPWRPASAASAPNAPCSVLAAQNRHSAASAGGTSAGRGTLSRSSPTFAEEPFAAFDISALTLASFSRHHLLWQLKQRGWTLSRCRSATSAVTFTVHPHTG
ncbi:hypothetical protein [Kitasatospora sp. NPDC094016]|uniref:hypothetical protein n=1 Tax=Kitasatospora sp. NPDC094016 TaxID=3154986 RepID=UPI00333455E8